MELKNYPAPYVLFGALLAMGNRLQAAGDRFYDEITTKQWFVLAVLETADMRRAAEAEPVLRAAGARCGKFASKREAAGFEAAAKGICGSGAGRAGRTQEPRAPNPKVRGAAGKIRRTPAGIHAGAVYRHPCRRG